MTPGTIFVSHRAEYRGLVETLKRVIENASRGHIKVFISERIPGADKWRETIEAKLVECQYLFLIYGAPHEDWSWCLYEAGFFAGNSKHQEGIRKTYCICRPNIPAPGPVSHLQVVTDLDALLSSLEEIYKDNKVDYNMPDIRESVSEVGRQLFRKLEEYTSFPRLMFVVKEDDFPIGAKVPPSAVLKGDKAYLNQLFGIGLEEIRWAEIATITEDDGRTAQERQLYSKWVEEIEQIIVSARKNRFKPPQSVLIGRGGVRVRFLPYQARVQGDGAYCCDFLIMDEIGGPTLGLSPNLHALMTALRLAVRFRYEFIRRFPAADWLSDEDRRARIEEIPRIIRSLEGESSARGNTSVDDLEAAFEDNREADRIRELSSRWTFLKTHLYAGLGLSPEGKAVSDRGLVGPNLARYQQAYEALRLTNLEFLSLCCKRVSQRMRQSDEDLQRNAIALEGVLSTLRELSPSG